MKQLILTALATVMLFALAQAAQPQKHDNQKKDAKPEEKVGMPTQPTQIQTPADQTAALRRSIEYLANNPPAGAPAEPL